MRMGIFRMSIISVLMSLRFETSPKTKLAAGSVRRPCRGVPIMIGRKTARANSCSGILRFVAGTEGSLQAEFATPELEFRNPRFRNVRLMQSGPAIDLETQWFIEEGAFAKVFRSRRPHQTFGRRLEAPG